MKRRKILFYTEAYRENNGGAAFLLTGKSAKRHCCSLPNEKYVKKMPWYNYKKNIRHKEVTRWKK